MRAPWLAMLGGVASLLCVLAGVFFSMRASDPYLAGPGFKLVGSARVGSGHQRAGELEFSKDGRYLALTCPRYNRLVLFGTSRGAGRQPRLEVLSDVVLEGRPVDVAYGPLGFYVLQRPAGDARHLEPGFWQVLDVEKRSLGERFAVGYDPDALGFIGETGVAVVLLSGKAEGESNRPDPSLLVVDASGPAEPRRVSELDLGEPGDDPTRLLVIPGGEGDGSAPASVVIARERSASMTWVDLSDIAKPVITGSTKLPGGSAVAGMSLLGPGSIAASERGNGGTYEVELFTREAAPITMPAGGITELARWSIVEDAGPMLVGLDPEHSAVAFHRESPGWSGRVILRGSLGLGGVEPVAVAVSGPWMAVADRSGGVHLMAVDR